MSKVSTFFSEVGKYFKKLFGSTTWEKQVSATISYVSPLLDTVIALTAGAPAAAAVQLVINEIQKGLATLATVVSGAVSAPSTSGYQTAINALNSIKTNVQSLLTVAEVKNPTDQAKLADIVDTFVGELDAVLENVPTDAPSAPSAPSSSTGPTATAVAT